MVCIYCGSETSVTNSRPQKRSNTIWRRRLCTGCLALFTTIEQSDLERSLVVNCPNGLEPFIRDKLFISVYDSLKHKKTALSDATALTSTIVNSLLRHVKDGAVHKNNIITVSLDVLKRFDKTAAVYYAAYHPLS